MFDKFPIPDGVCHSFPHLICNETIGLKYDDWCWVCKEKSLKHSQISWPKPGAKLKFNGTKIHWYKSFVDDANNNLIVGEMYTLKDINPASSHCPIKLEETGDLRFELSWFTEV